jgi:hypothetical protein
MEKLTFDEVICNARIRENQLYFMVFGEKNFKVNRRSKDRLHLTCSRKETTPCIFSIRCSMSNGNVMMRELKQTHSCSLKLRSKLSERNTALLISSTKFCQLSNSNYQYAFPTEIKYDSPIETNEIKISSAYRDDNLGRSASSSNFCQQENLSSQNIITSAERSNDGNTSRSASSDLDDYSVVGSDSDFVYPTQENISSQNIISSAARCSDGNTSRSSSSDLDYSVPRSDSDFVYPTQENISSQDIITSAARCSDEKTSRSASDSSDLDYSVPGDSSIDSNSPTNYTNLTRIMAIFDSLNLSSEQKVHLSSSLNSLLQHQFGLPFVRELYLSYDAVHREKMITDLCMLRSLYRKDINLLIPRSFASEGPVKSPCSKKRKFLYSEFEDDGDSVTYLDKLTYKN